MDHLQVARVPAALRQAGGKFRIELDRYDSVRSGKQAPRQRSPPRAHLDHDVPRTHRGAGDPPERRSVAQEVLS